jgi:hypothetical protein
MEIRRALDWLLHDRPAYWTMEIKRAKQALSEAEAELFRRKLQARPGSEIRDTEQKENVRKMKRRVEEAETKLETVKRWSPVFQHAVTEYQARSRPTADMLEGELKLALALLDRMTTALDAYIATAPPSSGGNEPVANVTSTAPSAASQVTESVARPGEATESEAASGASRSAEAEPSSALETPAQQPAG